jgi:hypothetical protein
MTSASDNTDRILRDLEKALDDWYENSDRSGPQPAVEKAFAELEADIAERKLAERPKRSLIRRK